MTIAPISLNLEKTLCYIPIQNRRKLDNTALTSIRYRVSSRVTAAIATPVLNDFKLIKSNDMSNAVDKSKVD